MAALDQFIDQPRHYALGAAIELGWHAFGQRSDLGDLMSPTSRSAVACQQVEPVFQQAAH